MLDMSQIVGDSTRVLSGKQRGESARTHLKLDGLDAADEPVEVTVPAMIEAMTPSFFLGMFGLSVQTCGSVDAFLSKYHFKTYPHVLAQIRRGAEYSLVKGSAFGH